MNVDTGPCRALESRDPEEIARAFLNNPRPSRSSQLLRAVVHSTHALSIPIKIGIKFVAQTQAMFWSIQHSLCSLECAVLLCSWLDLIAHQETHISKTSGLSSTERRTIKLVQSLLHDAPSCNALELGGGELTRDTLRRLASAVARV